MITVKWRRQNEWREVYTGDFDSALAYARNSIVHGGITQRIELHDNTGSIRCVYDSTWNNLGGLTPA